MKSFIKSSFNFFNLVILKKAILNTQTFYSTLLTTKLFIWNFHPLKVSFTDVKWLKICHFFIQNASPITIKIHAWKG